MKLVIALLPLLLTLSSALKESVTIYRSYHLKNSEGTPAPTQAPTDSKSVRSSSPNKTSDSPPSSPSSSRP